MSVRTLIARVRTRGRATIGRGVRLGPRVMLEVAPGAMLEIGEGARLDERCRVHVRAGRVTIGAGARLGESCVVAAHERLEIGARCRLEGENLVVDFDHVFGEVDQPVREQGIETAPVRLGDGAILDRGASVLRGVTVGAGARVLPHAVVTSDVPAGATSGGARSRAVTAAPPVVS